MDIVWDFFFSWRLRLLVDVDSDKTFARDMGIFENLIFAQNSCSDFVKKKSEEKKKE